MQCPLTSWVELNCVPRFKSRGREKAVSYRRQKLVETQTGTPYMESLHLGVADMHTCILDNWDTEFPSSSAVVSVDPLHHPPLPDFVLLSFHTSLLVFLSTWIPWNLSSAINSDLRDHLLHPSLLQSIQAHDSMILANHWKQTQQKGKIKRNPSLEMQFMYR